MNRQGKRRKEVNSHISLYAIKQYLLNGKYPQGCSPTDKRGIRKRSESFKLKENDLFYIARPKRLDDEPVDPHPEDDLNNYRKAILTTREQLEVTARAHVGETGVHKGTERTLHGVSSQYYWVGMSASARQVVKNCAICLARQDGSSFESQVPAQAVSIVANVIESLNESKEVQAKSNVKEELGLRVECKGTKTDATDLAFTVTSELGNLEEADPDLNFDVDAILGDGRNLIEECRVLKARRFWERVEIMIISPSIENKKRKEDGRGRHKSHTIVALDSFSKWPEAKKLEKTNELSISQFIIQLISRFGVMNQLVFLENDSLTEQSLVISGISQNLSMFDVNILVEPYNLYDENWTRLSKCVSRFVKRYPSTWSSCLDLCLVPLRNSVASQTDYTPNFVVTRREPVFPSFLFPHKESSNSAETLLNHKQIDLAVDRLMTGYLECCEPDVKRVIDSLDSAPLKLTHVLSVREDLTGVRRSGRKVTLSQRLADYEHIVPSTMEQIEDNVNKDIANLGGDVHQSMPLKKRKHVDFANGSHEAHALSNPGDNSATATDWMVPSTSSYKKKCDGEDLLNKLDSCTFYQVIKLYVQKGQYPMNSPVTFKRVVRKAKDMYSLEDGKLMYFHKNKIKKTILMTMKERLKVMDDIHTSADDHVPRSRMLDLIEQRLVYWKNCSRDVDAYVKACPGCKHGKTRLRVKRKPGKKWQGDEQDTDDENDWSMGEKYQGRVSSFFPDLIEFLDSGAAPSHLSRSELVIFKKKAKSFKLVKRELYYCASPATSKIQLYRKVLVNERQRLAVMQKAHGESHNPPSAMLAEIKKQYYWHLMQTDIENYVGGCCQSDTETQKDKMDNELNQRVNLFARHFKGEDISKRIDLDALFQDYSLEEGSTEDPLNGTAGQMTLGCSTSDARRSATYPPVSSTTESNSDGPSMIEAERASQKKESKENRVDIEEDEEDLEQGTDEEAEEEEDEEGESFKKIHPFKLVVNLNASKNKRGVKMRCKVCKKIVRGENNLKEHMYKHNGIKPFSCEICNKKLTSIKGIKMHMRKHTGHRPYLCNICGRGFPRSASLRYHIKTHDRGGTVPVICDVCDRVFTSEHRMKKHKRFKHPEKRPVFTCDTCGKNFTAKRSLKRHEEAHQGIRRYMCSFCNRSFFRKEYLTYHLDSHYKDDPDKAHLASKRKRRISQRPQSSKDENSSILSIYTTMGPDAGQDKIYTQLVEVSNSQGWTEGATEVPAVFSLDGGTLQVGEFVDHSDPGTAVVTVEEGVVTTSTALPNTKQEMDISHIIMPPNINSQHQTTADHSQLHSSLPPDQQLHIQHTQNEITLTTETAPANTPIHIEKIGIIDSNHHNIQEMVTRQFHQIRMDNTDTDNQQELQQQHVVQGHGQDQPGAILPTITTPGASSSTDDIIPSENINANNISNRHIEVRMANGQKLMLSRTNEVVDGIEMGGQGEEMVQYRVECLSGEPITEEHLNTLLAQAGSLLQP